MAAFLTVGGPVGAQNSASGLEAALAAGELSGELQRNVAGDTVFRPLDPSLPLVYLPEGTDFPDGALRRTISVTGALRPDGLLQVEGLTLPNPYSGSSDAAYVTAARIVDRINEAIDPVSLPMSPLPRTIEDPHPVARATKKDVDEIIRLFGAAHATRDTAEMRRLATLWRDLRIELFQTFPDGIGLKSVYGTDDVYRAWRIRQIFRSSTSVVGIAEVGEAEPHCSGVLISPTLILTASHCITRPLSELEVFFGFVELPGGGAHPPIRRRLNANAVIPADTADWTRLLQKDFGPDLLDYVVLSIEPAGNAAAIPLVEVAPGIKDTPEPQCLSRSVQNRGDPLYVIGYPEQAALSVHTAAYVEFPYAIRGFDLPGLELDAGSDFVSAADTYDRVLVELQDSYIGENGVDRSSTFARFYYHSMRNFGQPSLGIVADTSQGNSGGPVYTHRKDQCVVGLLVAGKSGNWYGGPTWFQHEVAIPIEAILDDMEHQLGAQAFAELGLDLR